MLAGFQTQVQPSFLTSQQNTSCLIVTSAGFPILKPENNSKILKMERK